MKKAHSPLLHFGILLLLATPFAARGIATNPIQGSGEAAVPLGYVTSSHTAYIQLGSDAIAIPAPNFVYFAGTRIATASDPHARLLVTLRDGSILLGPDSAAVVTGEAGAYQVAFEKGTLGVRFGSASRFEVVSGGVRVRPYGAAAAPGGVPVEALFGLQESGELTVLSHGGALEAVGGAVGGRAVIASGTVERFDGGAFAVRLASAAVREDRVGSAAATQTRRPQPKTVLALDEALNESLKAADARGGWFGSDWFTWRRAAYVGGGLAVTGTAVGLGVGLSGGGDDDPVTSPVN